MLGSPRFVHRAGALAGLAGIVCGSVAGTDVDASLPAAPFVREARILIRLPACHARAFSPGVQRLPIFHGAGVGFLLCGRLHNASRRPTAWLNWWCWIAHRQSGYTPALLFGTGHKP